MAQTRRSEIVKILQNDSSTISDYNYVCTIMNKMSMTTIQNLDREFEAAIFNLEQLEMYEKCAILLRILNQIRVGEVFFTTKREEDVLCQS